MPPKSSWRFHSNPKKEPTSRQENPQAITREELDKILDTVSKNAVQMEILQKQVGALLGANTPAEKSSWRASKTPENTSLEIEKKQTPSNTPSGPLFENKNTPPDRSQENAPPQAGPPTEIKEPVLSRISEGSHESIRNLSEKLKEVFQSMTPASLESAKKTVETLQKGSLNAREMSKHIEELSQTIGRVSPDLQKTLTEIAQKNSTNWVELKTVSALLDDALEKANAPKSETPKEGPQTSPPSSSAPKKEPPQTARIAPQRTQTLPDSSFLNDRIKAPSSFSGQDPPQIPEPGQISSEEGAVDKEIEIDKDWNDALFHTKEEPHETKSSEVGTEKETNNQPTISPKAPFDAPASERANESPARDDQPIVSKEAVAPPRFEPATKNLSQTSSQSFYIPENMRGENIKNSDATKKNEAVEKPQVFGGSSFSRNAQQNTPPNDPTNEPPPKTIKPTVGIL